MPRQNFNNELSDLNEFKRLRKGVSLGVNMAAYTTMRVGGPAKALYAPESISDLIDFVKLCKSKGFSYLAIGSGSNIIINDKGTQKIFIRFSCPSFRKIEISRLQMTCGSGVLLSELLRRAEESSLGGAEFLTGIPGTVGGAIVQNAGAQGRSISDIVKDVRVLDGDGEEKTLQRSQVGFGYRKSAGMEGYIVLAAAFRFRKRSPEDINSDIRKYMKMKLSTQDYTAPSAGCIFKNPEGNISAGKLIDELGLKGKRIGGACVSERHANFIINRRNAKAKDVLRLIDYIKKEVRDRYGIKLEEEVKVI